MLKLINIFTLTPKFINSVNIITKTHFSFCNYTSILKINKLSSVYGTRCVMDNFQRGPLVNIERSMFIYRDGDMLWEGVTGPPGRAKKRARGKRRVVRNKVDLNFGRRVGESSLNYKWPGLNAPILEGSKIMKVEIGKEDHTYKEKILEIRNKLNKRKISRSVPPLKRGWSGTKLGGQSMGPPEEVLCQKWQGYDSRILELKMVSTMTATKGRLGRFSAVVIVGNCQGLAGIGKGKSTNLRNALRIAKNQATERFEFYDLRENRTLWHPDFIHEWGTKVYVKPMQEGYGLVCHRVIKTMCQLIGVKDMYAKVEGSTTNYQVIARAFTGLLRKQETYQRLSNRMKLNVVEIRSEFDNYPRLLASPEDGVTRSVDGDENLDFERLHLNGKVFRNKKYRPFYWDNEGHKHFEKVRHRFRNQEAVHRTREVYDHLATVGHFVKEKV